MESRSYRNIAIAFCLLGALAGVTAYRHQDKKSEADKEQTLLDAVSGLARKQEQLEDGSRVGRMKLAELLGATLRRQLDRDRNILGTEGTNSPIKIRGGAMTFRANKPWHKGKSGTPGKACYFLTVKDVSFSTISMDSGYKHPAQSGWTMRLAGRDPHNPKGESGSGIMITTSESDASCDDSTDSTHSTHAITLTPFGSGGGFYDETFQSDDDKSYMERFKDNSTDCQRPSGDEDVCERMSRSIKLVFADRSTDNPDCLNGECEIDIW